LNDDFVDHFIVPFQSSEFSRSPSTVSQGERIDTQCPTRLARSW
jgi:hypothetical protein